MRCPTGYQEIQHRSWLRDIDECWGPNHLVEGSRMRHKGGYYCQCPEGYTAILTADASISMNVTTFSRHQRLCGQGAICGNVSGVPLLFVLQSFQGDPSHINECDVSDLSGQWILPSWIKRFNSFRRKPAQEFRKVIILGVALLHLHTVFDPSKIV
ncbi:hypothetical protein AVEN_208106-1 [Araneus ventricosus]|uniref:Uncharacterized protein n=1 Tax=Araneus ventricosus TaxID=182803 RepID=A0A4Y2FXC2_ARAVE|nr:hypothetical protein AVEN_208106-1 [Araneus ventricosus]